MFLIVHLLNVYEQLPPFYFVSVYHIMRRTTLTPPLDDDQGLGRLYEDNALGLTDAYYHDILFSHRYNDGLARRRGRAVARAARLLW